MRSSCFYLNRHDFDCDYHAGDLRELALYALYCCSSEEFRFGYRIGRVGLGLDIY